MSQKRNARGGSSPGAGSKRGSGPVDLLGHPIGTGVGARRGRPALAPRGGGYLNVCTPSKFAAGGQIRDPGVDELRAMGMPEVWLKVAHAIGSQNFIRMWSILGAEPSCESADGAIECKLRPFRSYLRFQRNRYIEELSRLGWDRRQIHEEISRQLCENLSDGHISRLMRSGRSKGRP